MESTLDKIVVKDAQAFREMPREYQDLVIHQLRSHTEGELAGADNYVKVFYDMSPNAYEKQVCCERAGEEVDHYMKGARILSDLGVNTDFMLSQTIQERLYWRTEGVREVRNWAERAIFSWLGESAVLDPIREMGESSYRPIAEMIPPVIQDELTHVAHGYRIVKELIRTPAGKAEIQEAVDRQWPVILDVFGRSDSARSKRYLRWGLRVYSNGEARQRWMATTKPKLEAIGLTVPDNLKNRKFL